MSWRTRFVCPITMVSPRPHLGRAFNIAAVLLEADRFSAAVDAVDEALAVARERGDRWWERQLLAQRLPPLTMLGRWDEAVSGGVPLISGEFIDAAHSAAFVALVATARGEEELLDRCLPAAEKARDSEYVDERVAAMLGLATVALARGAPEQALELAESALPENVTAMELVEYAYVVASGAAETLGDRDAMTRLIAVVDALPLGRATPLLRAGRARLAAEMSHLQGDEVTAAQFEDEAIALLREIGARPLLAQALIERGRRHRNADALSEARAICQELGAHAWLGQLDQMSEFVL